MEILSLFQALENLSPSTVLDSESLLHDFRQFLLRGTPEQCLELIPLQYRPSNNATISIPQSSTDLSPTSPSRAPSDQLFPQLPSIVSPSRPKEPLPCTFSSCNSYDRLVGLEKRQYPVLAPKESLPYPPSSSNLDRRSAVININNGQFALPCRLSKKRKSTEANIDDGQGRELAVVWTEEQFIKLKANFNHGPWAITSCDELWGSAESLIDMSLAPGPRLYKLFKGSDSRITQSFFANRLSLIFVTHEVDCKTLSIKHTDGAKRKTKAFDLVAADHKCSVEEIKTLNRRGNNYIKMMEEVGAVILFELGKDASNLCEFRLRDDQRKLFAEWLQEKYFSEERIEKCIFAAKLILDGLTICGEGRKDYARLRKASSRLLNILRKYMTWGDDGTIHKLPKDHTPTHNPAHQTPVGHPGTPNQTENRRSTSSSSPIPGSTDNSPYYSGPGGSGAVECHNDSLSKQVCNGRQLSPIGELSLEEREAAQMLQQFQQSTSDPPRSQQLREVSMRGATRECSQVSANDHGGLVENDTDVPSHTRPIADSHMAQCTGSGQDSVPRMQHIDVTNDIVRIPPRPEEMTELVSVTSAAGNISNFEDNSFTFFEPHDPNEEPPMVSQSHSQNIPQGARLATSHLPIIDTTRYSQNMDGQILQGSQVQQLMTSYVPMIDTTQYSQNMDGQILQGSEVQQLMTSHAPMIDTTRYSQNMELMNSRIYSHNIQHSIPQRINISIQPQYIQEADGSYNQFSSFQSV
ncbi:hypothetical protein AJ78_08102 [Emergomyces pasteurianus Ep9510]|uniref:Uncharacterized protein n=1 Tax=Emergomyces pasteurianus Ep9510 TaxID=1447872 RepID=A0A1J9Q550_9EURO|nr:hypothetical protein AJ78_08102 [Emergomyces pasteurianus Ep9510]